MCRIIAILALTIIFGRGYSATLDKVLAVIKEDTSGGTPLGNNREFAPYFDPDGRAVAALKLPSEKDFVHNEVVAKDTIFQSVKRVYAATYFRSDLFIYEFVVCDRKGKDGWSIVSVRAVSQSLFPQDVSIDK
jgi:hypothetical protein